MPLSKDDLRTLRDLGKRVAEVAVQPEQAEKAGLWRAVNRLRTGRPPVLVWISSNAWTEIPEDRLVTEGELAQSYERDLRRRLYYAEYVNDDRVITDAVPVPLVMHHSGWGVEAKSTAPAEARGARSYEGVLRTFADLERITPPRVTVDWDATARQVEIVRGIFDGILRVETAVYWGNNYGFAPMDTLAIWRGFEQLFLDLTENPGFVHDAMARLTAGEAGVLEQLEAQGALHLNNGRGEWVGTGGLGETDELPAPGFDGRVRLRDVWVTCSAQIFAPVSPAMHEEFCLRYERPLLERFGLTCYGCCEPLDKKIGILKTIRNLRRVSISPWADVATAAAGLRDNYILSWKPNPAIASGELWDSAAARRQLREFLHVTRGCIREIILKDVETVRGEPMRLTEWLRIAREEIEMAK